MLFKIINFSILIVASEILNRRIDISLSSDISYFFCLPSPFIRTTKSHLTMVPHAGLHSILRNPIFLSFASRNEKSTRGGRGERGDKISSSPQRNRFFCCRAQCYEIGARCLSASRISIERPFPVRFHVAKKITTTAMDPRSWADFVHERPDTIDYGIKLRFRFCFSSRKGRRALDFHLSSHFNTFLIDIYQIKVSIISKTIL